mgnify:CR=1 FL=1
MENLSIKDLPKGTLKTNLFNERFLYEVNRDSFSKISASAIFDEEFKKILFHEDSLYIIIGTDSGLLPQYIQQYGVPAGTHYLFVELPEIITQLNQHKLLTEHLNINKIALVTGWSMAGCC